MSFRVACFVSYLSNFGQIANFKPRNEDYNAAKFKQAIKGETVRGYAWITHPDNDTWKLEEGNKAQATSKFATWAARYIASHSATQGRKIVLVPVPNSIVVVGYSGKSITRDLADAVLKELRALGRKDAEVRLLLQWTEKLVPARQGGTRDPEVLITKLACRAKPDDSAYVLVDDACASGGRMLACEHVLSKQGADVVFGVAAVKALNDFAADDPFAPQEYPFETIASRRSFINALKRGFKKS